MKFSINIIDNGNKATIYSVTLNGEAETEFDKFCNNEFINEQSEFNELIVRLDNIANRVGAQEQLFYPNEGKYTDSVVVLKRKNLRLYCIRFGNTILILGGGGVKKTRTYQEDEALGRAVDTLSIISEILDESILNRDTYIKNDKLYGKLKFGD